MQSFEMCNIDRKKPPEAKIFGIKGFIMCQIAIILAISEKLVEKMPCFNRARDYKTGQKQGKTGRPVKTGQCGKYDSKEVFEEILQIFEHNA